MKLPFAIRSICLISVLSLATAGALAQDDAVAERAAAVEEALTALQALSEPAEPARTTAEERAAAVEEARAAFEALAADFLAAEAEQAAAERAAAVEDARSAFANLAEEAEARAREEAAAAREAAVADARAAFEAMAAESAAAAAREAAVADARAAFEAMAAEAAAVAAREAAVMDARSAFEVLAAESAARAEAEAALAQCLEIAGEPSAENFPSEEAQATALRALRDALPSCRAAAEALPDEGAPLYHLATAAQASGRHRRAVPLYEQAAENGVAPALTRLGDYHNFGLRPVREDVEQAVAYYRQASEAGDPAGTATLAFMYRLGRGVERNPAEMLRLMQDAADAGYPFAQYTLAQTFLNGDGVSGGSDEDLGIPDPRRAVPLLVASANAGILDAVLDLIGLYSDGADGVPPNDFLRGGWVEILAETGDPAGIAARGFLFEQGIGREANPELAAADYVAALETGEVNVDTMRGTVEGRTPPWDRDTAMAFQTILADRGLYTLRIDGDVGPGTRRAANALSD